MKGVFPKPLKGRAARADKASMGERLSEDGVGVGDQLAGRGFGAAAFACRADQRTRRAADDLHVCPACASDLVIPIDWAPARTQSWRVQLRCPDCEWSGGGVYSQKVVDRFDEALDLGTDAMLNDLALLARANMEAEVDRFVAALVADHILPEDF
jgi:hypothetical protein